MPRAVIRGRLLAPGRHAVDRHALRRSTKRTFTGNLLAKRRVNYTREILAEAGFEPERLRMVNIGAADARPFAEIMRDMVETVRKLGPTPLKRDNAANNLENRQ